MVTSPGNGNGNGRPESNGEYRMTIKKEVCPENCRPRCNNCNTCVHSYSCTCQDYTAISNICKRIRLTVVSTMQHARITIMRATQVMIEEFRQ